MQVTQKSAESVGESFKTIYSRFGNVKAGKFVASQADKNSADYNEDEFESLNDIETVLTSVGIKLKENATTYREIDEVLEDIAKKWGAWDSVTKNAVTTAIAGTRQRVITYSVYLVIGIGHNTYVQVKGKASHQNKRLRLYLSGMVRKQKKREDKHKVKS